MTADLPLKAHELAARLRDENDKLISVLKGATDEEWRNLRPEGELRSIGVIALHVAILHGHISRRVRGFAHGEAFPPRALYLFDERNARQAAANPEPDRVTTVARLRAEGEAAARLIESLSDEQLDRTGREDYDAELMKTREVIEQRQIAHVAMHRRSIASALSDHSLI